MMNKLVALGFGMGDSLVHAAPQRASLGCLRSFVFKDPRRFYNGRGSTMVGLTPSKWGNPFRITKGCPRKLAISSFASQLGKSKGLMDCLPELDGAISGLPLSST